MAHNTLPRIPELYTSENLVMNICHAGSSLLMHGVVDTSGTKSSGHRGRTSNISRTINGFLSLADTPKLEAACLPLAELLLFQV